MARKPQPRKWWRQVFVDDWNSHDIKSFAALFAENADFVNVIGLWWRGRPEIQKAHEALHATRMRNSHLVATETAVRVLRPGVAVTHVRWELTGDTGIDGVTLPPRQGSTVARDRQDWEQMADRNSAEHRRACRYRMCHRRSDLSLPHIGRYGELSITAKSRRCAPTTRRHKAVIRNSFIRLAMI
jgi:uncharacterized protein (TIGR02246 family)